MKERSISLGSFVQLNFWHLWNWYLFLVCSLIVLLLLKEVSIFPLIQQGGKKKKKVLVFETYFIKIVTKLWIYFLAYDWCVAHIWTCLLVHTFSSVQFSFEGENWKSIVDLMVVIERFFVVAVLFANEPVDLFLLPGKCVNVCH